MNTRPATALFSNAANAAGSDVIERLRTALPFVELANTDDDFMTLHAEGILMGSAFEQLVRGDGSSYKRNPSGGCIGNGSKSCTTCEAQSSTRALPVLENGGGPSLSTS